MLTHPCIHIGDTARFPLGRLGLDEPVYRHRWEAVAFTHDGCIVCRRLHDGIERTLSFTWWDRYTLDERQAKINVPEPLPLPKLNADRTKPGFYASVREHNGPNARYILAAGPFSYPGDADRLTRAVRHKVNQDYGSTPQWWDLATGTCRVEDGTKDGIWNRELGVTA